jgi:Ca-activated chloride channel homolog
LKVRETPLMSMFSIGRHLTKTLIALLATSLYLNAYSQQPGPVIKQPAGAVVKLDLIVVDSSNQPVERIRKDDIRLIENDREQIVGSIDPDDRPTDIAVTIDVSGSFREFLPAAIAAADQLVTNRRSADEILIERFVSTDKIRIVQDFTADYSALMRALGSLYVEGGQSAVFDAIHVAVDHLAKHRPTEKRRKVLVLISDGENRNSSLSADQVVKELSENGVQVFILGVTKSLDDVNRLVRGSAKERAEKLLKRLATESGGRLFLINNTAELTEQATQVVRDLRNSFRITYQSSDSTGKPGFRKIEVKFVTSDKRKLIHSSGYVVSGSTGETN